METYFVFIYHFIVTMILFSEIYFFVKFVPRKRHHTNPVGTEWRWKMDPAEKILQDSLEKHQNMIRQFRGWFFICKYEFSAVSFLCIHISYTVESTSLFLIFPIERNMDTKASIFTIYKLLVIISHNGFCV